MESRIDELKRKYWDGNTTLDEEAELKSLAQKSNAQAVESIYFEALLAAKTNSKITYPHPAFHRKNVWRMAIAASFILTLLAGAVWWQSAQSSEEAYAVKDPQEAYRITQNAMLMLSVGLNEGAVATTELKNLNKAEDIIVNN